MIFGLVESVNTLRKANQMSNVAVPIVSIKTDKHQSTPEGTINFVELADPKSKFFLCVRKVLDFLVSIDMWPIIAPIRFYVYWTNFNILYWSRPGDHTKRFNR